MCGHERSDWCINLGSHRLQSAVTWQSFKSGSVGQSVVLWKENRFLALFCALSSALLIHSTDNNVHPGEAACEDIPESR
jgi:hypothetical protein